MKNYYKVSMDGSYCIFHDLKSAFEMIEADLESLPKEDLKEVEMIISIVEMSEKEYAELPEFEGF